MEEVSEEGLGAGPLQGAIYSGKQKSVEFLFWSSSANGRQVPFPQHASTPAPMPPDGQIPRAQPLSGTGVTGLPAVSTKHSAPQWQE